MKGFKIKIWTNPLDVFIIVINLQKQIINHTKIDFIKNTAFHMYITILLFNWLKNARCDGLRADGSHIVWPGSRILTTVKYFCINHGNQRVFQFETTINILVSSFWFIYLTYYSAGIDIRRQNLTSPDVRFWRLKSIAALLGLITQLSQHRLTCFVTTMPTPTTRQPENSDKNRSQTNQSDYSISTEQTKSQRISWWLWVFCILDQ